VAPVAPVSEKIETPVEQEYDTRQAVLEHKEPEPHVPRTVKLPES